ncbi:MAG: hypothetical protein KGS72_16255 [Cyanobacteria bacterium REEB67]|nr:hypothetical protein [Cyanobacteria bacterium REEB67]
MPELKITASEKPHSSAVSEKRLSAMSAVEKSNLLETTFEKISKTTHHSQMSEQQFDDAVRLLDSNGIPGVRLSPNEEAAAHFVEGHFHDLMKSDRYTAKTIDDITFKNHTIEVMYPNMLAGLPEIVKGVVGIAAFVPTVPATCGFSLLGVAAGIGYIGLGAMKIAEHRAEKRFDGALISELK